jgi:hypothetical protein
MAEAKSIQDALQKARALLETTQRGLQMVSGPDPTARPMGIHNVAVFGRSVTIALQNLRTVVGEDFDRWYEPHVEVMKANPLFEYFKKLRNEILKEGPPPITNSATIKNFDSAKMARLTANPPPGATGFFIGDTLGGSGWVIEMPDGSKEKFYVTLPNDIEVTTALHLVGQPDPAVPIHELCREYVGGLSTMVEDAESHFGA